MGKRSVGKEQEEERDVTSAGRIKKWTAVSELQTVGVTMANIYFGQQIPDNRARCYNRNSYNEILFMTIQTCTYILPIPQMMWNLN